MTKNMLPEAVMDLAFEEALHQYLIGEMDRKTFISYCLRWTGSPSHRDLTLRQLMSEEAMSDEERISLLVARIEGHQGLRRTMNISDEELAILFPLFVSGIALEKLEAYMQLHAESLIAAMLDKSVEKGIPVTLEEVAYLVEFAICVIYIRHLFADLPTDPAAYVQSLFE